MDALSVNIEDRLRELKAEELRTRDVWFELVDAEISKKVFDKAEEFKAHIAYSEASHDLRTFECERNEIANKINLSD